MDILLCHTWKILALVTARPNLTLYVEKPRSREMTQLPRVAPLPNLGKRPVHSEREVGLGHVHASYERSGTGPGTDLFPLATCSFPLCPGSPA